MRRRNRSFNRSSNRHYNYRISISFPCGEYGLNEDPYRILEHSGALEYFKPNALGRGSIR